MSYFKEELLSVLVKNPEFTNTEIAAMEGFTSFVNGIFKKADAGINFIIGNSHFFEDGPWFEFWKLRDHNVSFDTVANLTVPTADGFNGRMINLISGLIKASDSFRDIEKGVYDKLNKYMAEVIEDVDYSEKLWAGAPVIVDLDDVRDNITKSIVMHTKSSSTNITTGKFKDVYPSMPEFRTCISLIGDLREAYRSIDVKGIIEAERRCAQLADKLVSKGLLHQMNQSSRTNIVLLLRNTAERTELLSACFYLAKVVVTSVRDTNIILSNYKD